MSEPITIYEAGLNTAGMASLVPLRNLNQHREVRLHGVDIRDDHASNWRNSAGEHGLTATTRTADVVDILHEIPADAILIDTTDHAGTKGTVAHTLADNEHALLGTMIAKVPTATAIGDVIGLRYVHRGSDHEGKHRTAEFLTAIGDYTAPAGRERIFGMKGAPEHQPLEPLFRHENNAFIERNIPRLPQHRVPLQDYELEVIRNSRALPVFVMNSRRGWRDPLRLSIAVLANPPAPIVRGDDFVVGEHGPDGVRLHFARLRHTDGRVSVRGVVGFDPLTIETAQRREAEQLARLQREFQEVLRRAVRATATRMRPFFTTD